LALASRVLMGSDMSSTKLQQLATKAFRNGTPRNFMTTAEARRILAEAERDGKVTRAEHKELKKISSADWTYNNDDAFGRKEDFARPTLSVGAGSLFNRFCSDFEG
jgi:hypothetical protein